MLKFYVTLILILQITDPIYFLDNSGVYVKLTEEIYNNILEGKIRLWIRNFFLASSTSKV